MQKIFTTLFFAFCLSTSAFAEANYVYHEQTANNPGCGPNYMSTTTPGNATALIVAWKIEYQTFTNQTRIYYTTDGSTPGGAFGVPSGTTKVVTGSYNCTFTSGGIVDVATAQIPAQPTGTVVKYIIGAWHSGGGAEIFANGPGAGCACGTPTNNSSLATLFTYTVIRVNNVEVTSTGGSSTYASYPGLAAAVAAINPGIIHTGTITCNVVAGHTETAPAGGFSVTATTGTAGTPIKFQKQGAGANPTFTASAAHTAGVLTDAIFKIIGGDFITIDGFTMLENAANLITAASTNNMTEFGVALFYTTITNGAQNNTIQNNIISLNKTYLNTFGIYSNNAHSAIAITAVAPSTGASGANSGIKIYGNSISNVNLGISIVGSTASAADFNVGVDIGGTGSTTGNTISNYGTATGFSGYLAVSGTLFGVFVRNSTTINVSYNSISSPGTNTSGTMRGIYVNAFSFAATGTFTNSFNNNSISVLTGLANGTVQGIALETLSASTTSTVNVNNNNFTAVAFNIASPTGSSTVILTTATHLNTNINNNTFTNLSSTSTGSFTFISQTFTAPATGTKAVTSNSIVTAFTKTGAGGTVTFVTDNGSTVSGAVSNCTNNNFSNGTLTGATAITGISYTDGGTAPTRTVTGNTINNWTTGAATINAMNFTHWNGVSSLSSNTITNLTGQGAITGITMGSTVSTATSVAIASNTITNLTSTGTGGAVTGISCTNSSPIININNNVISILASTGASPVSGISLGAATTTNVFKNTICDLSGSNASSTVNGILVSSGTTVNVSNNRIGDLRTPSANAANPLIGLNITGGTTVNAYYNTINLAGASSGALFGSSAISASTTPTLTLNNNIFNNTSTTTGAGLAVAYRRSLTTLTTYANSSDRNDFNASTIYSDGTNTFTAISTYKTFMVAPRDANSISVAPPFLSTVCGNANFLKINTTIATQLESGGVNITGITDDFENDIRQGNTGYSGSGTAPDIGADEFNGTPVPGCIGTPAATTITGAASVCSGKGTTLSLSTIYTDPGITYLWSSGTTPGGPYPSTLGTAATQATGNLTVATYYICTITCTSSTLFYTTAEKSVLVNALPTVAVSPATGTICNPGGAGIVLTASGASTYTWSPSAGLSATTGTSVTASPASTTTYTVTGTDVNGCTSTATSVITVGKTPVNVTALATPSTICSGATSNLTSSAFVQNTASLANTYTFAGSSATYVAISGTVLGAGIIGDDVGIGNLPIGFTFNYNGTTQTVFGVSSNGLIQLGNASATFTGFSANALSTTANIIAGIWDDNNTTGSTVEYTTTGAVGSKVLTVQWTALHVGGTGIATNPTISLQIKLYEATGQVQIVYGSTSAALTSTTASIGISGASGNFVSVTPLSPANTSTSSTVTENASISSATNFPTGTTYSFTPPSLTLSYAWTAATNLGSPNSQNTATTALIATETFTVIATSNGCSSAGTAVTVTVSLGAAITAQPVSTIKCAGQTATFTVGATGPGLTYQWRKNGTNILIGGNASAGTATLSLPNVTAADAATYDVVVTSTCGSPVTSDGTSTLMVNALPAVTVSPTSANYCSPSGSAIPLTAGGASTYAWSPAAGLSATTGATVNASPSSTTTYTVTGTDGNSCMNTATSTITVTNTPQNVTALATPATICSGGTSNLTSSAYAPTSTTVNNYTFSTATGATLDAMIGATTIVSASTDDAPMNTSVGANTTAGASVALPFSFNYDGANYTFFSASPDGWLTFKNSNAAASSQFTNATTSTTNVPKIYPYWDDLATGTTGSVKTLVTGTSPNRIFIVQWFVTIPRTTAGAANSTFQVWMYETTNKIEFRYGTMGTATGSVSSGLTGSTGANFQSITLFANTASNSTANDAQVPGALPASGKMYTFAPPSAAMSFSWALAANVVSPNIQNTATNPLTATETFTVTANNGGCTATAMTTVNVTAVGTWTGAVDNDWNVAGNWCGGVPTATTNMIIPAGATVNITSANAVANSVTIQSSGTLNMLNAFDLSISSGGSLTNNGTFTNTGSTGMVSFLGNGTIAGSLVFANLNVNGTLVMAGNVTVNGLLSLALGGVLNLGNTNNQLILNGDISGAGTISGSSSASIKIGGSGAITGALKFTSGSQTLSGFEMNRTGGIAMLGTDLTVTGVASFVLTEGKLATNGYLLTVDNNSISGGGAASYIGTCDIAGAPAITGGLRINSVGASDNFFPVGSNFTAYNPATLNNSGTTDDFTVRVGVGDVPNTPNPSVRRLWDITEGTPGGSNVALTFGFMAGEEESGMGNPVYIVHVDGNGNLNERGLDNTLSLPLTGMQSVSSGTTRFTSFSPFGITSGVTILPIGDLISFDARKVGNAANINWTVSASNQFKQYEVMRSTDGRNFITIASVSSVGSQYMYQNNVALLNAGTNYFRLKITEKNGTILYSKVAAIVNRTSGIELIGLTPTLVKDGTAYLNISAAKTGRIDFVVYDITGKRIRQIMQTVSEGNSSIRLDLQFLASGMYTITGYTPSGNTATIRFVKE